MKQGELPLLLRADASARRGTGHVMRCLALAQAWCSGGGRAMLASMELPEPLQRRLAADFRILSLPKAAPGSGEDAEATAALARAEGCAWVVVDGYDLQAPFCTALRQRQLNVLQLDDYAHADRYAPDVLLNQNLGAQAHWYAGRLDGEPRLLLGPAFALLRPEFTRWRDWTRAHPARARRVMITLGGADADNVTAQVLYALRVLGTGELEVRVVVGAGNPHRMELQQAVEALNAKSPAPSVTLLTDVKDMSELMAWADLGVTAGGSTTWEAACLGLPVLVLVLADNQAAIAGALQREGLAMNMGTASEVGADRLAAGLDELAGDVVARTAMSGRGRSLVDGLGARRVAEVLRSSHED